MIIYLYRWRLRPEKIEQFKEGWASVTQMLLSQAGSFGSRLHLGSDGIYYGYAQWPSPNQRDNAQLSGDELDVARAKMRDAIAESFPEIVLDPLLDYLDVSMVEQGTVRVPALNQITLRCGDLEHSIAFYQKLDLTLIVKGAHYARFECPNGATLSLEWCDDLNQVGAGAAAIYLEHPSLEQWIATLKTRGMVFEQDADNKSWLWREAWLKDPFGNRVCLYHAGQNRRFPPWRLLPSGGLAAAKLDS